MKLRLAEYKNGKFEKFLELGKDFLYGGDFIIFTRSSGYFFIDTASQECREQFKDQKDPLNRFGGLFDGRTYGEGRFVLILNIGQIFQDDVLESRWLGGDLEVASNQPDEDKYYFLPNEVIGNLHENPELWEKVK
jgi:hypothetical protein